MDNSQNFIEFGKKACEELLSEVGIDYTCQYLNLYNGRVVAEFYIPAEKLTIDITSPYTNNSLKKINRKRLKRLRSNGQRFLCFSSVDIFYRPLIFRNNVLENMAISQSS